ncbi:hypothetical protein BKA62DRAFT_760383 [Auriculariales sp. MPI-PUGE-AT-0066]|nr:hypothetical protein BKA62DRAFT_760383 [Auriculariales sp. MPI-PUGE-AT-0066]
MTAASARSPISAKLRDSDIEKFFNAVQAVPSLALQVHGLSMVLRKLSEWDMLAHILHAAVRIRSIQIHNGWRPSIFETAVQMLFSNSFSTGWMELKSLHLQRGEWPRPMSLLLAPMYTQWAPQLERFVIPDLISERSTATEEGAAIPAVLTLVTTINWLEQNVQRVTWSGLRILSITNHWRNRNSKILFHTRVQEVILRASASDNLVRLTSLTMTGYGNTDAHFVGVFQCLPRLRKLKMRCTTPELFETTMAATPKGLRTLILDAPMNHSQSKGTALLSSLEIVFNLGALGRLRQLTLNFSTTGSSESKMPLAVLCQRKKIRLGGL